MTRLIRIIITFLLLASAAGTVLWLMRPQPVAVDVASITQGDVIAHIREEGETRIREVYTLSAPVDGQLQRITLKVGDNVIAGETVMAQLKPGGSQFLDARSRAEALAALRAAEAARALAEASLRRAVVDLDFARSEERRAATLYAQNHISDRALEEARLKQASAEATLAEAEAFLATRRAEEDMAHARLITPDITLDPETTNGCCISLYAPADGRILRIHQKSEMMVRAGMALIDFGDPADLEVVSDLLSTDAVRIRPGTRAWLEDWGGQTALPAVVRKIEPFGYTKVSALGIEEQRVNVVLDMEAPVEIRAELGHGYRVMVRIETGRAEDVLRLPLGALFRHDGGWAVYAVREGRTKLYPVEIGLRNDSHAVLRSGLEVGMDVILYPPDRLQDGDSIYVQAREDYYD